MKDFLKILWENFPELLSKMGIICVIILIFNAPLSDHLLLQMILSFLFFWFGYSLWEKK